MGYERTLDNSKPLKETLAELFKKYPVKETIKFKKELNIEEEKWKKKIGLD